MKKSDKAVERSFTKWPVHVVGGANATQDMARLDCPYNEIDAAIQKTLDELSWLAPRKVTVLRQLLAIAKGEKEKS